MMPNQLYMALLSACLVVVAVAQKCSTPLDSGQCSTVGSICKCIDLRCIPNENPCSPETQEVIFVRSWLRTIPPNAFTLYPNVTYLTISGNIDMVEPGAFTGLDNLMILRLNSFSLSPSAKNWYRDIDTFISYSIGITGIRTISEGTFQNLPRLRSIDLSFNRISSINKDIFDGSESVQELGLVGNSLETLNEQTFKFMPNIHKLYMSKNQIQHLVFMTKSSRNPFRQLDTLDLFGNKLTTFPSFILQTFANVSNIDLRGNPLICDCNMLALLKAPESEVQIFGLDRTCSQVATQCSAPIISPVYSEFFDVLHGDTITLIFEVTGKPHPLVSITGPDGLERIGTYNIQTNQVTLDISILSDVDIGNYTCEATNSINSMMAIVEVRSSQPKLHTTPVSSALNQGHIHLQLHYPIFVMMFILSHIGQ